ncbi:MAG: MFS transporter [Acidobacteriota bacterium]
MASSPSKFGAVFRVATGNFFEMFDFMVFGYYASAIARAFFPAGSAYTSLMLAFMTFGAGYLMRPIGAVVLGSYIDHHGRRKGLVLTLALMAFGTLAIACVPGYATLGLLAPLLVLAGRLVQGLSAGVEVGGVSIYLAEIATPGHRGFYCSWQSASQQVAVMFAASIGLLLTQVLSPVQMQEWGWRLPLLLGCALIPFVFVLRRSLTETPDFLRRVHKPTPREVVRALARNWRLVGLGMMLSILTTVTFYLITAYTPTFGTLVLHLNSTDAFLVTMCVGLSNFALLPVFGAVSDRVGRRPQLIIVATVALLTAYPVLAWLVAAPSFSRLLLVELWFSLIFASYNGAMVVHLAEVMPAHVRAAGFSLAFSLATGIFGGFTPAVSTYLIHVTGNRAIPGVWLSLAAALGLIAAIWLDPATLARHSDDRTFADTAS